MLVKIVYHVPGMAPLTLPTCPIPSLSHLEARPVFAVRSQLAVESSWGVGTRDAVLFECPETGLRFRRPPSRDEIQAFYGESYHDRMAGSEDEREREQAQRREARERVRHLRRYLDGGRVLDVGCSKGIFASELQAAGFEVCGADISEYACKQAAEVLGPERVFHASVEELAHDHAGTFDAITLLDVIEHFPDVVSPLEAMYRLLRPGGVLFLRTPTLSSPFYRLADWSYRLSGGRYVDAVLKIYHAEHFFFFTEGSMRRLLGDVGFDVLEIVLGTVYFLGRLANRGHGMKAIARRP